MTVTEILDLPDGTRIEYPGPTVADIRKVLKRARHRAYNPGSSSRAGYVVRKPRDVAYVHVTDAVDALLDLYAETLTAAGYIAERDKFSDSRLVVFKPAT